VPVGGALVSVLPTSESAFCTPSGSYFIGNVQQGVYTVMAYAPGYEDARKEGVIVNGGWFTTADIAMTPDGANRAPVLALIGDRNVSAGETLRITPSASDADTGDTLVWSLLNAPAGMTIDTVTGMIQWATSVSDTGIYPDIVVQVSDNGVPALSDSETITVTVGAAQAAGPYITGPRWAEIGGDVRLTLMQTGLSGTVYYQWHFEGTPLAGEESAGLLLESVTLADGGWYQADAWTDEKSETVTAHFELIVVEAMPAAAGLLLAGLVLALGVTLIRKKKRV
jgi:hypothetical protein